MSHPYGKHPVSQPWTEGQCRACWHYVFTPDFKEQVAHDRGDAAERTRECFHLGDVLDQRGCRCQGKWLRECDVYGQCTRGDRQAGVACCANCSDYTAEPPLSVGR